MLAAVLCVALAAPAGAWVETASYDVPGGEIADCLRAAGPGKLALLGPLSRSGAPLDLFDVGASSLTPARGVPLDLLGTCPEVAASADGQPPLVAETVANLSGGTFEETVRVATPGHTPATLPGPPGFVTDLAAAEGPDGTAAVAWLVALHGDYRHVRLLVAVRPAGQASFGAPATLSRSASSDGLPAIGADGAGHVTVAWMDEQPPTGARGGFLDGPQLLRVAESSPAGGFGAPQTVTRSWGSDVALAVTPQDRALLAAEDLRGLHAWERPAGATRFTPVRLPDDPATQGLTVAMNPDGGTIIGFRSDDVSVFAFVRRPGGAFANGGTIVPDARGGSSSGSAFAFFVPRTGAVPPPPHDEHGGDLTAALAPDGEALLTWVDDAGGTKAASAHVAHGTLARGFGKPHRLGNPCRSAAAARPLPLADGRLAAAWADDARTTVLGSQAIRASRGHVHEAVSSGEPPRLPTPAPGVEARLLASSRPLGPGEPLRVRVRCHAGCDVRAAATGQELPQPRWALGGGDGGGSPLPTSASTSLPAGGTATLTLLAIDGYDLAGVRGRRQAPVVVLACTPDGPIAQELRLAPPPIRPPRPIPRVVGLVARRHGGTVRVTWRTTIPARDARFWLGGATRSGQPASRPVRVSGRGRARFAAVLRPGRGQRIERVFLQMQAPEIAIGASLDVPVR